MHPDRRKFIKNTLCAALGGASVYSALGNLQLLHAATRASNYAFTDYKALVCVYLYGGNDAFNTIVPISGAARIDYQNIRPGLALPAAGLQTLNAPTGTSFGSPGDGSIYGLHPAMPELASVFNAGKAAIVANVGTLVSPVTKNQYQNGSPALPPQLFSHADQTAYWQSSPPSNTPATGWGGRVADLVASANPPGLPILTGLGGLDVFIRGQNINGYIMNPTSASQLYYPYDQAGPGIQSVFDTLRTAGTQANALERTYAAKMKHSIDTAGIINAAQAAAQNDPVATLIPNYFPGASGDIDAQLQTVAQLIWAANNNVPGYTGLTRQVFFVTTGGYDTHGGELTQHQQILPVLSRALAGFYHALNSVGLANTATAFTASDFGRSLSPNQDGTDHGWGSHHFVVGGAVNGGKFYGDNLSSTGMAQMPSLLPSAINPNDGGYGQIIPTTAVDQYSATLANWFGLSGSDIALLFPNLAGNFTTQNLGFV